MAPSTKYSHHPVLPLEEERGSIALRRSPCFAAPPLLCVPSLIVGSGNAFYHASARTTLL